MIETGESCINCYVSDNELTCNLLKMTNSITAELIPYSTYDLEKKTFNWTVSQINESEILFKFIFDNPMYIS